MIKLINIIKEIKIQGKLTKEMVVELWQDIFSLWNNDAMDEVNKAAAKYSGNFEWGRALQILTIFRNSKQNEFYQDLINIRDKYNNIQEIKVRSPKRKLELLLDKDDSLFTKEKFINKETGETHPVTCVLGDKIVGAIFLLDILEEEAEIESFTDYLDMEQIPFKPIRKDDEMYIVIDIEYTTITKI